MDAILKSPLQVSDILARIHDAGVHIRVESGRIVAGPRSSVTEEVRALIRSNKDAILAALPETAVTHVTHVTHLDEGERGFGYTVADLQEMDRLIRELGQLEGWTDAEIEAKLAERRRMAPVRVPVALRELKAKAAAALAPWPERPAKRSRIVLCVIEGGKSNNLVNHQREPEAA